MILCCICGRQLGKVKLTYQGRPIGPECGLKNGVVPIAQKRRRLSKPSNRKAKRTTARQAPKTKIDRDNQTLDLFGDRND